MSKDKGIDKALGSLKAELEMLDKTIAHLHTSSEELRPTVKKFEELRQRQKELKRQRRDLFLRVKTVADFIKDVTGEFPDYMYPLFAQEKEKAA